MQHLIGIFALLLFLPLEVEADAVHVQSGTPEYWERVQLLEKNREWERNLWDELISRDQPWILPLYTRYVVSDISNEMPEEEKQKIVKETNEKLLARPNPGAVSLYWAASICDAIPSWASVCPKNRLLERLMQIDSDNFYSQLFYFDAFIADKTGINKAPGEDWDWSYFDRWLGHAVKLNRFDSYRKSHFRELVKYITDFGSTEGVLTYHPDAPLEWKSVLFVFDETVYPRAGGGFAQLITHCEMSRYLGQDSIAELCRQLAENLYKHSRSYGARSYALELESVSYSKDQAEFLRLARESKAWEESVRTCANRISKLTWEKWSVKSEAENFLNDFERLGEIEAWEKVAVAEGWYFVDEQTGLQYQCHEIPDFDDDRLSRVLGSKDPAWTWCRDGTNCEMPKYKEPWRP